MLGRLLTCACNAMMLLSSQSLEALRHMHTFSVAIELQQTLTMVLTCTMEHGKQNNYIKCPGRMQADNTITPSVTANMR